jgi:hypothetical protein
MNIREVIAMLNQMESDRSSSGMRASRKSLRRHNLVDAWAKFERQFLGDTP